MKLLEIQEIYRRAQESAEAVLASAGPNWVRLPFKCLVCGRDYVHAESDAGENDEGHCFLCGRVYRLVACEACQEILGPYDEAYIEEGGIAIYICEECAERLQAEEHEEHW